MNLPIIAQRDNGSFIVLHGENCRADLKAASLPEAIREVIKMGLPCPKKWWTKDGRELDIPAAVLPR